MDANLTAIGLMSGTSADGIDAVLLRTDGHTTPQLLATLELPYPEEIRKRILDLFEPGHHELDRMGVLDQDVGKLFAQAALAVCRQGNISPTEVDVIGSHGQTIRHRPSQFTLQIGNPFVIAAETKITTVADFRPADVARGGDGAPLTPLFHQTIFGGADQRLAIVNLGGIANLTALQHDGSLIAGDTGPANTLMDLLASRTSAGTKKQDRHGECAAQGRVINKALEWLMSHPYLAQPFPKSTGREIFGAAYLDDFIRSFPEMRIEDQFATLTRFSGVTVAEACQKLLPPRPDRLVLCGGGVRNPVLVREIQSALPGTTVLSSNDLGVNADFLEGQAFAWFAVRTLKGLPSSSPKATRAKEPAILGAIYPVAGRRSYL